MGLTTFQQEIIQTFTKLREILAHLSEEEIETLAIKAANENTWFTPENIAMALKGTDKMLSPESLNSWLSNYPVSPTPQTIGLIMAGNIPMVGLHDLLCVLASGNVALVKLSSKDQVLIKTIAGHIHSISQELGDRIRFADNLKEMDAVIATGSNNSARYFEYYFSKYPHIIRKNRTSVAILNGSESFEDFQKLGVDIFSYFGLGCRNVSKIFVPEGYNFTPFFEGIESFSTVIQHHKYHNNYDFNKSVLLVNNEKHLDNGFLLVREAEDLVSPISVLYYETYSDRSMLIKRLTELESNIQCIVEKDGKESTVALGKAQFPGISAYADNIDTMKFLTSLPH